ncbi:aldehyde dehydrogenase family protein [Chitinibacter fontanus]|uniref:L-glutamate gamma-semialdehyde dehydrogenase n=1 Tax=Chitinibacter fontanus TaxID=1737446 RepID=A0A7D5VBI6_9NEIS|nr:aldehyde dehydrogenase family protein [Chitinibacter fontanus]QLI82734.1 aldehyde dehydrogenase family protein [Chitinibacter fontanus]
MTYDHRCAGVCFTGSLNTAKQIRRALAEFGADRVLVAETGGVNAMIVDSSAQIDQAIRDILISAFDSAGQRCSALRLLCVQAEIADELLARLKSCLHAIIVGSPSSASTEVGPIIRPKSRQAISLAIDTYLRLGYQIKQSPLTEQCQHGCFIAPTLIEIDQLKVLSEEIFGPVLCAYRYQAKQLDTLLEHLNQQGFGLTLGIHSRIKRNIEHIIANTRIGNYYVNRNQIGAVVEAQPFGGQNKSGTGPKAGGPWAHWRLVCNADPCMPHYQILPSKLELLRQLAHLWPDMDQGVDLEILLEDAARRSPIDQIIKLPAVSGETNELRYRGRGKVACFGPSDWDLIQQVGIAILTGNQAVITQPDLFRLWQKYLGPHDLIFSEKPLQLGVQAVLSHSLDADRIEKLLAQQDGAIIPLIQPFEDGKWPLFRLVAEYTVTTNTSATGGDVALLTQGAQ